MLEKLRKEVKQLETTIGNIKEQIEAEQDKLIKEIFIKLNSPLERIPLLKKLSVRILQLDGVSFRTTENSIAYQVNGQNFMSVYPQVNALRVEHFIPDGWSNCKLNDDTEIDGVIVLIEESHSLMREKKK